MVLLGDWDYGNTPLICRKFTSMNKTKILYFGLGAGLISTMTYVLNAFINVSMSNSEVLGYVAMLLALTLVFFGIKSYRDNDKEGHISFGEGFRFGLGIVIIASMIYVIGWEIYYPVYMPDFASEYQEQSLAQMEAGEFSQEEYDNRKAELESWITNYEKLYVRVPMTFMEIFPVGLIIALFSALILKKKPHTE